MRFVALLSLLQFAGCAHTQPDWTQIRNQSVAMRVTINGVAEEIAGSAPLVDAACAIRGRESPTCHVLRGMWSTAGASITAAHKAIDLYDSTGVALDVTQRQVDRVIAAADTLRSALDRFGKAVSDATAQGGSDSGSGGDRPPAVVPGDPAREGSGAAP